MEHGFGQSSSRRPRIYWSLGSAGVVSQLVLDRLSVVVSRLLWP